MKNLLAALLLASSVVGCATAERTPPPDPVIVKVVVPVPCDVPDPAEPAWAYDSADRSLPLDALVQRLRAEAVQREAYTAEWKAALAGCRLANPRPAP